MRKPYRNNQVRNKLEKKVYDSLCNILGKQPAYEKDTLEYTVPASTHKYTPDFRIRKNVYIETKGIWDKADRDKILLCREQHPEKIICMCFYNSNYKIYPGSKTTYGDWCDQNLIPWCDIKNGLPKEWFEDDNFN